jgi:FKBP-type peptidyl-prolyl cis-trans isomerase (trigger factor)
VAQKEGIGVTEKEMDLYIAEMARLSGQSVDIFRKHYDEKKAWSHLEASLREEKILDFVLSQSTIKS